MRNTQETKERKCTCLFSHECYFGQNKTLLKFLWGLVRTKCDLLTEISFSSIHCHHSELLQFESHYQRSEIRAAMILLINFILSKYQAERISHLQLSMTLNRILLMSEPFLSTEYLPDSSTNVSQQTVLSPCSGHKRPKLLPGGCRSVIGKLAPIHQANWRFLELHLAEQNVLRMHAVFSESSGPIHTASQRNTEMHSDYIWAQSSSKTVSAGSVVAVEKHAHQSQCSQLRYDLRKVKFSVIWSQEKLGVFA